MTFETQRHRNETVVTLRGSFGAQDVQPLRDAIAEQIDGGGQVTIDFREVRVFHDSALALLARELAGAHHVAVLGLSEHHDRVLRYMGLRKTWGTH